MPLHNRKVTGVRVLDIAEEGATAIETMVNQAIKEVQQQKIPILDIQITDTNCFIILGEKKSD
jgi:predicted proteasome-type protease